VNFSARCNFATLQLCNLFPYILTQVKNFAHLTKFSHIYKNITIVKLVVLLGTAGLRKSAVFLKVTKSQSHITRIPNTFFNIVTVWMGVFAENMRFLFVRILPY